MAFLIFSLLGLASWFQDLHFQLCVHFQSICPKFHRRQNNFLHLIGKSYAMENP